MNLRNLAADQEVRKEFQRGRVKNTQINENMNF